jgi:hypothetical protein
MVLGDSLASCPSKIFKDLAADNRKTPDAKTPRITSENAMIGSVSKNEEVSLIYNNTLSYTGPSLATDNLSNNQEVFSTKVVVPSTVPSIFNPSGSFTPSSSSSGSSW